MKWGKQTKKAYPEQWDESAQQEYGAQEKENTEWCQNKQTQGWHVPHAHWANAAQYIA